MLSPTLAETHLGHIRANLEAVRTRVGDRRVLAAVKADAYGHGAVAVARMIEATGAADWLGVATLGEGIELRAAGIGLPVLKLSVARGPTDVAAALEHGITLTVVDEESIVETGRAADAAGRRAAVHLKIDTGMRRIGCEPADAVRLARLVDAAGLDLEGLMSHLPISDSPRGEAFTAAQVGLFRTTVADVERARGPVPLVHLANSGGILGHPDSWFDLVRPGIMIYGSYPDPEAARTVDLLPGLRWTTAVSFVKRVRSGETVGYGRTWTAPQDTWIATVPVGYGDGYSRLLSNRGRMLVAGRSYPIAGRVCMDQTMIDLGPTTDVAVGDEVVLIGRSGAEEVTVSEIAALIGTIPYEVTCLVNRRVGRAYRDS